MRPKPWRWALVPAVIVVLALVGVQLRRMLSAAASTSTPQFVTARVGRGSVDETVSASGTLEAKQAFNETFNASGQVQSIHVAVGDRVHAGQVLATLADTQGLAASVAQARSSYQQAVTQLDNLLQPTAQSVAQAKATLASAQAQLQKDENPSLTIDPNTIASDKVRLQQAQLTLKQDQGVLKQDQDALATAQADTTLTAPVAGTVESTSANVGQSLSGGQTVLTIVPPGSAVQVQANVSQQANMSVQVGDAASAHIPAISQVVAGTVTSVGAGTAGSGQPTGSQSNGTTSRGAQNSNASNASTPDAGTIAVTITLSDPPPTLTDGMTALVNIFGGVSAAVSQNVEGTGSVQYANEWAVTAAQGGTLAQLSVSAGQSVTKGQQLGTLTGQSLQTALRDARQTVQQAQIKLQQDSDSVQTAQLTLQNDEHPQPPTSGEVAAQKAAVASAQTALQALNNPTADAVASARASVASSQANLQNQQQQLARLKLVSPIDGSVVSVNVLQGQLVSQGTAGIVVQTVSQLELVVPVDEIDITRVKAGETVDISLDSLPGHSFKGKVVLVAPASTSASSSSTSNTTSTTSGVSTYDVTISVPADPQLKPGMSATAAIQVAQRTNVLRVPAEAVQGSGPFGVVQVLRNGVPRPQRVGLGLTSNAWTEVTSGLKQGDVIVVARAQTSGPQFGRFRGGGQIRVGPGGPRGGPGH